MSNVALLLIASGGATWLIWRLAHADIAEPTRRISGWALLLSVQFVAWQSSQTWGGWWRLLAAWVATFVGFKALIIAYHPATAFAQLSRWNYTQWMFGWLGMDVEVWCQPRAASPIRGRLWREGIVLTLVGAGVVGGLSGPVVPHQWRVAQAAGVWVGLIIAVFLGATRLLTAWWHTLGRPVGLLFDRPMYARSVAEWWGQRWNTAVHTTLARVIWRPLQRRLGTAGAGLAVFGASGVLHEYLLSYPARGGYGSPMLYFLLQAGAVLLERRRHIRTWLRLHPRVRAAWVLGATLLPAPLLFHPPLLRALVQPWLGWWR